MDQVEYLMLAGAAIGMLVRLLKSDKLNLTLAAMELPPIPKRALPWIAAVLGVAAGAIDAMAKGAPLGVALRTAAFGFLAGALATWGHEAGVEGVRGGKELGESAAPPPAAPPLAPAPEPEVPAVTTTTEG